MFGVAWGEGHVAMVDDSGNVLSVSDRAARAEIERRMVEPLTMWLPDEKVLTLNPGEPGFVAAVLRSLDGATVTV